MNQYKYQVRFTNLPGGPDNPAEFIETETVDGKGVGSDHGFFWKNDGDTVLLMIPNGQWNNAKEKKPGGISEVDASGIVTWFANYVFVITDEGYPEVAYYHTELDYWGNYENEVIGVAYWMLPPSLEELNESVSRTFH